MSKHDNGGPAFPGFKHYTDGEQVITGSPHGGMSLRDYFAAKAMQAFITNGDFSSVVHGGPATPCDVSAGAYEMADAMLAERNK